MAQRGYGEPRGGEWGSDERERGDRERGRSYGSSGYGRSDRDDDRGFFERAGEEIRSWFSDDDERSERGYQRGGYGGSEMDRGRFAGGISDRDRERSYGRTSRGGTDYMDERRAYGRSGSETSRGFGPSRGGGYWESDRERGGMPGSRMSHPGGQQGWQSEYGSSGGRGQSSDRDDDRGSMYSQYSGTLGGFGNQRVGRPDDQFYMSWRDRQLSELDRDYDDYCREREQSFHQDFGEWRRNRRQQNMGEKGELQLESEMTTGEGSSESSTRGSGRRGRSASSSASAPASTTSETSEASTSGSDRTRG